MRVYGRVLTAAESKSLADRETVTRIARCQPDGAPPAQADKIRDYFLANAAPAAIASSVDALTRRRGGARTQIRREHPDHDGDGGDGHAARDVRPATRGAYDKPGEKVSPPCVPALPAAAAGATCPHNRLGLARWLVGPANPLTARVAVNRFWQMFFGTGLVKTRAKISARRASRQSHPELLDWLAAEFVEHGLGREGAC